MGIRFSDWVASLAAKGTPANADLTVILDSAASNAPKKAELEDLPGSGGGGSVATDAIWDAKGDLAGGTGANTAARLPVGTNGQVLTADSAETTGLKWADATPGPTGPQGPQGDPGATGATGPGVAAGGAAGEVLAKGSSTDYDTEWVDLSATYVPQEGATKVNYAVTPVAATGATENIDMDVSFHDLTMDQACTFTFTNKAGAGEAKTIVFKLSGAFTATFTDAEFGDGAAPTYTSPSWYTATSIDGDTKVLVAQIAKAVA
jgi:hypothetical protein